MRLSQSIIVILVLAVAAVLAFELGKTETQSTAVDDSRASEASIESSEEIPQEIPPQPKEPETFDVVVKFTGAELNGQIIAGLFNSEEDFGKRENPLQRCEISMTPEGEVACEFKDLPPGTYVISAFEDSNGNSKLDKNGFGIPQEKYGFSNNARGRFGPPKYLDCKFEVADASELEIKLR